MVKMKSGQFRFNVPDGELFDIYFDQFRKGIEIFLAKKKKFSEKIIYLSKDDSLIVCSKLEKNKKAKQFSVRSIVQIREGITTEKLIKLRGKTFVDEKRCLSIIFRNGTSLNFMVMGSWEDQVKILKSLQYIIKMSEKSEKNFNFNRLVKRQFALADKNKDGRLSLKEITILLRELNTKISSSKVKKLFDQSKLDNCLDGMSQEEFSLFYGLINDREEIRLYFNNYAQNYDGKLLLSPQDLQTFLHRNQHEERPIVYCRNLVSLFSDTYENYLTIHDFTSYLTSDLNEPTDHQIQDNMDCPLHEYYIATSHNTYLMEHQLHGKSSVEGYIQSLSQGCRCVELDCYDGFREPQITHGGTLTGKISFRSVVEAINDYAFVSSEYPVILSIENHCSKKGENQMANIFKNVFKDRLYVPNPNISEMPSPEELKLKFIIKNKKSIISKKCCSMINKRCSDSSDGECSLNEQKYNNKSSSLQNECTDALFNLVGLVSSRFEGFQEIYTSTKIYSFSESVAKKLILESPVEFAKLCRSVFVKVYPKGARAITSSNLNPAQFWAMGASVVAINYQYPGDSTQFNEALFPENLGYVLKPAFLRNSETTKQIAREFRVKIISGVEIPNCESKPNDIVDPFVMVTIYGSDSTPSDVSTQTISDNGFNPVWNKEFFFQIKSPETAFVKFCVMDSDLIGNPNFIGQRIFRIINMRKGVRAVHLRNKEGHSVGRACILIDVDF